MTWHPPEITPFAADRSPFAVQVLTSDFLCFGMTYQI